jgi:hypothetical protein
LGRFTLIACQKNKEVIAFEPQLVTGQGFDSAVHNYLFVDYEVDFYELIGAEEGFHTTEDRGQRTGGLWSLGF